MGGFQGQQRKYDPFSNTYNAGWKDHPNFGYAENHYVVAPINPLSRALQNFQSRQPNPPQTQGKSLEYLIATLTPNIISFQNDTKASIKNLENQVSQLATMVGRIEAQESDKLPYQIMVNPREMLVLYH